MEERVNCKNCNASILSETAERYEGACKPCYKRQVSFATSNNSLQLDDEPEWELAPENSHPIAKQILKDDFFWSIADDGAPLDNDTGADILAFYREQLETSSQVSSVDFLNKILEGWEVENKDWNLLDEAKLSRELENNHFNVLTRDDAVIAVAFSQIVLEGTLNKQLKQKALLAVERQMLQKVIEFRGWVDKQERLERLLKMQTALKEVA